MKNIIKLGTLFSGIGAIEQAVKQLKLKHKIIFACDNDKFVKESYFANYDVKNWYNNVYDLDGNKYKDKINLLVGGSPCQSFSLLGNRKGTEDARGLLIFEFIRILEETQPKMFIFENVKGLTTHNKGQTWKEVLERFKSCGGGV